MQFRHQVGEVFVRPQDRGADVERAALVERRIPCGVTSVARHRRLLSPGNYPYSPGSFSDQCSMFHFWSPHLGDGANFLFCDGSVRFIPYSAAPIMPALASRAGGEAVTPEF